MNDKNKKDLWHEMLNYDIFLGYKAHKFDISIAIYII